MTAVAPPLNFQSGPRTGWTAGNGASNGMSSMSADMFMPRKGVQRSNSSSSIASSASSSSTISSSSAQQNGNNYQQNGDPGYAGKKRPAKGLWPTGKADAVAALSTARSQPTTPSSSGPSAASAISALHTPSSMLPSQQGAHPGIQQNGMPRTQGIPEGAAVLHLLPMNGTFERKTITVPFFPDVLRIGRQTNNRTVPLPTNGFFDSKVLSRQHAEIWADRQSGKIWIRDVKSSNGTWVNGQRLSLENKDSDPHELREADMLELGIDIVSEDQKTVVHHKVAARVEHAGFLNNANTLLDMNFGDLDPSNPNGGLLGQSLTQNSAQARSRAGSQGSMASNGSVRTGPMSIAGNNMAAMNQRQANFWLTPITMDQVVKKINSELKTAKQQSRELHRAGQIVDGLLAEPKKDSKAPLLKSMKSDLKTRYSDPPAPPPQQPLPEKPDAARSFGDPSHQHLFRRSDTERSRVPTVNGSPVKGESSNQVSSLIEALHTARKEIDLQSVKLKDLEGLLVQERQARETAEEKVHRLEQHRQEERVNGSDKGAQSIADAMAAGTRAVDAEISSRLQARIESLVAEMGEVKKQMEDYRRRAEDAEEDRRIARSSLAEMVERIRATEADKQASHPASPERKSGRVSPTFSESPTLDGTGEASNGDLTNGHMEEIAGNLLKKAGLQNGRPVTPEQITQLEKAVNRALATRTRRGEQAVQAAPYASIVGVVVLGLGLMAYLNGWQKVDR